ncbi:DUF2585 family protein [Stieleria varia]|uniref:Uncharacterized protein n=1 Tax=Stieleria varia TaxID=2528005 RepID=A0A5C5ZZ67_9BACT|nr:DUF2585 family protein [Stieleria varia]TWT92370.1 hypothetical protein Pla52n_62440 [Stieleria varia]
MQTEPSLRSLAIRVTAITAVMAVILHQMGRTIWCACGQWTPWSWDIWTSHNSQHLIDPYFFSHVLHGVIFAGLLYTMRGWLSYGSRLLAAVILEAGWEILENSPMIINRYREATISLDYFGDSVANSVFDVLACLLGFLIASRLRWYWSVAFFVIVELVLLATIRDCLTLNVVMLISPIEAIKQWQSP